MVETAGIYSRPSLAATLRALTRYKTLRAFYEPERGLASTLTATNKKSRNPCGLRDFLFGGDGDY